MSLTVLLKYTKKNTTICYVTSEIQEAPCTKYWECSTIKCRGWKIHVFAVSNLGAPPNPNWHNSQLKSIDKNDAPT